MGLLLPHKSTVRIFPDMVTVSENFTHGPSGGGKRGKVTGFSNDSRYRLFRLLHSLRFDRFSFVTLTYGNEFPRDPRVAKVHLKAFRRATERRWGKIPAIWRCELQQRGAIHFHILYLDPPFIPVTDWNDLWDRARLAPDSERFGNSLDLKANNLPENAGTVGKYLGKYIAKVDNRTLDEISPSIGRIWGKWNISEPDPITVEISALEKARLDRLLLEENQGSSWKPKDTSCYTVFGQTMGQEDLRIKVLWELGLLLGYTRKVEHPKVSFDTWKPV